jgi:hypothetical protein
VAGYLKVRSQSRLRFAATSDRNPVLRPSSAFRQAEVETGNAAVAAQSCTRTSTSGARLRGFRQQP